MPGKRPALEREAVRGAEAKGCPRNGLPRSRTRRFIQTWRKELRLELAVELPAGQCQPAEKKAAGRKGGRASMQRGRS